jgi:hypothetical protein
MEVLDRLLYRAAVMKLDRTHWRLILQINHLISDAASTDILDKQFHAPGPANEKPQMRKNSIGDLFGLSIVPIEYVSNGRVYKGGNFNRVFGDFHDQVPVLLSLQEEPRSVMERFLEYKRFIRENNLNFINYMLKGYAASWPIKQLKSPFSFNSIIGAYDFSREIDRSLQEKRVETVKLSSPYFGVMLLENFSAGKLWISSWHNSGFNFKEAFMKNYFHLIEYLEKKK